MGKTIEGEDLRDLILQNESPKNLSLKRIGKEIGSYQVYKTVLDIKKKSKSSEITPDQSVVLFAVEQRLQKLYSELDRRDKLYGR